MQRTWDFFGAVWLDPAMIQNGWRVVFWHITPDARNREFVGINHCERRLDGALHSGRRHGIQTWFGECRYRYPNRPGKALGGLLCRNRLLGRRAAEGKRQRLGAADVGDTVLVAVAQW